jgi:hypothetical protein
VASILSRPKEGAVRSRHLVILVAAALLGACGLFRPGALVNDAEPAHRPPRSTSIYGDWVLASPDSTAFVGARSVELSLQEATFRITANYPGEAPMVVMGTVSVEPNGALVTLTPQTNTSTSRGVLPPGQPIAVLATAADNTMVFAPPPPQGPTVQPSSVWHRKHALPGAARADSAAQRP